MRGRKEVIKVAMGRPEDPIPTYRERDAKVYGPLALLPTVKWDGWEGRHEGWTVTHVNTGYAIGPSIPDRANALRAIYLLKDEDWTFRHPSHAPAGLRDRVIAVIQDVTAIPHVQEDR